MVNRKETSPEDNFFSDWALSETFMINFERPERTR